ncbi:MAG: VanW family protein [Clostridia bacterium]|nr:VanW family protein [Clostridia bacterium]
MDFYDTDYPVRRNNRPRRRPSNHMMNAPRPDDRGYEDNKKQKMMTVVFSAGLIALISLNIICLILFSNPTSSGEVLQLPTAMAMTDDIMYDSVLKPYIDERLDGMTVTVTAGGQTKQCKLSDFDFEYNHGANGQRELVAVSSTDAGGESYLYCTHGSLRYNHTKLRQFLDLLAGENCIPVVDSYYTIDYNASTMTVHAGTDGYGINASDFMNKLIALASSGADSGTVNCEIGAVTASSITADELYLWAHKLPKDAYSINNPDGTVTYYAEIIGIDFDKSTAASALSSSADGCTIPVKVTYPKIDLKELKKYTFPDLLATYYTYFSTSNKQRAHNLTLAASKINGKVLEPGEQLSFNETVGERTPENGFQQATVYTSEGTDEGYGGGICQTSSTLYYTCILSNLQIDERKNHRYTVTYMRDDKSGYNVYGNDATVNWGTIDYKFTNSKEYPLKLEMYADGGKLICNIRGTADGSTARFVYENSDFKPLGFVYKKPAEGTTDQGVHSGRTLK